MILYQDQNSHTKA